MTDYRAFSGRYCTIARNIREFNALFGECFLLCHREIVRSISFFWDEKPFLWFYDKIKIIKE